MKKTTVVLLLTLLLVTVVQGRAVNAATNAKSIETTGGRLQIVDIVKHEQDGDIYYEYVWQDALSNSTTDVSPSNIEDADWVESEHNGYPIRHRAAKEYFTNPDGVRAWIGCSQTDYQFRHYTRVRVVNAITGTIYSDSDRVWINSGIVTARTPDSFLASELLFAPRSFWGT